MFAATQSGAILNDDEVNNNNTNQVQQQQSITSQEQQQPVGGGGASAISQEAAAQQASSAVTQREVRTEQTTQKEFWDLTRQGFDAIVHAQKCLLPPSWAVRRKHMPTRFAELDLAFADIESPLSLPDYQRQQIEVPTSMMFISNRIAVDVEFETDSTKRKKAGKSTPVEDETREFIQYIFQLMEHCQADSPLYAITFAQNGTKIVQCVLDYHADLSLAHRVLRGLLRHFSAYFVEPTMGPGRQRYDPNATLIVRDFLIDRRLTTAPLPTTEELSGILLSAHSYTKDEGIGKDDLRMFSNLAASQMDIRSQATIGGVGLSSVIPHPTEDGCYFVACGTPALPYALLSHCPSISLKLQVVLFNKFGILVTVAPCNTQYETGVQDAVAAAGYQSTPAAPLELPPMPPPPDVASTIPTTSVGDTTTAAPANDATHAAGVKATTQDDDDPLESLYELEESSAAPPAAPSVLSYGGYNNSTTFVTPPMDTSVFVLDGDQTAPPSVVPAAGGVFSQSGGAAPGYDNQQYNNNNGGGGGMYGNAYYTHYNNGNYNNHGAPPGNTTTPHHPSSSPPSASLVDHSVLMKKLVAGTGMAEKKQEEADDGMFDFGIEPVASSSSDATDLLNMNTSSESYMSNMDILAAVSGGGGGLLSLEGGGSSHSLETICTPSTGYASGVPEIAKTSIGFKPPTPSSGFRMVKKVVAPVDDDEDSNFEKSHVSVRVGGPHITSSNSVVTRVGNGILPTPSSSSGGGVSKQPSVDVAVPLDSITKLPPPSEHYLTIPERNLQARRRLALSSTFDHASNRKALVAELRHFLASPESMLFWLENKETTTSAKKEDEGVVTDDVVNDADVTPGTSKANPHMVAAVAKPPPPARQAFAPVPPNSEHANETAAIETAEFNQHVKYDSIVRDYPPSLSVSIPRWWHVCCNSLIASGAAGQYLYSHATPAQAATIRAGLKLESISSDVVAASSTTTGTDDLATALDATILSSPLPLAIPSSLTHAHCEVVVDICSACNEGYNDSATAKGGPRGGAGNGKKGGGRSGGSKNHGGGGWSGTAIGLPPAPLSTHTPSSQSPSVWVLAPYPPHGAPFDTAAVSSSPQVSESGSSPSFTIGISNSYGLYYFKSNEQHGGRTYLHPETKREYYATPQAVLLNHLSNLPSTSKILTKKHAGHNSNSGGDAPSATFGLNLTDEELLVERGGNQVIKKRPHSSTHTHIEASLATQTFASPSVDDSAITAGMQFATITPEELAVSFNWEESMKYVELSSVGNVRERAAGDTACWGTWGQTVAAIISRAAANLAAFEAATLATLYGKEATNDGEKEEEANGDAADSSSSSPTSDEISATRKTIFSARLKYKSETTTILLTYFKPYMQMFTLAIAHYAYQLSDRGYLRRVKAEVSKRLASKAGAKRTREEQQLEDGQWLLDHLDHNVSHAVAAREVATLADQSSSQVIPAVGADGFDLRESKPLPSAELIYRDYVRREQNKKGLKAKDGTVAEIKVSDHPSKAVLWTPGPTGTDADGGSGGLHVTMTKVLEWLVDQNVRHELLDGYVMALLGTLYPATLHGV